MLTITIPARKHYDERSNRFIETPEYVIDLEHSLFSLSKWEEKWEKPFLGKEEKTAEETVDYIRAMTLTPNVPAEAYSQIDDDIVRQVSAYMDRKMTATWFSNQDNKPSREIVTAELLYYYMVSGNVPFETQYWHLNKLMTLLRVIAQKNNPGKKMSRAEILQRNRALNEQRKAQMKTAG